MSMANVWFRAVALKCGSWLTETTSEGLWCGSCCHGNIRVFLFITLGICTLGGKAAGSPSLSAEFSSKGICMFAQLQTTPEQVSQKNELNHSAIAQSKLSQREILMLLHWELLSSRLLTGCSFRPKYPADLSLSNQSDFRKKHLLPAISVLSNEVRKHVAHRERHEWPYKSCRERSSSFNRTVIL